MSKQAKIWLIVVLAVLVVAVASFAVGVAVSSNNREQADVSAQRTETPQYTAPGESNVESSTVAPDLQNMILGKWVDSANMSGYEFFADGTVDVTYVNLTVPVINIPINGSAKGTYKVNGQNLEVHFSIYSGNIDIYYTAEVNGNQLTLTTVDGEDKAIYMRSNGGETTAPAATEPAKSQSGIVGVWKSSEGNVQYTFLENSTVSIGFFGVDTAVTYDGVYVDDGNTLTVQYTAGGQKVTNEYTYEITGLSMLLTSSDGSSTMFTKNAGENEKLIGKWTDSANMSGYEFFANGTVDITYVNLTVPVVNIPINGKFTGSYTVNGNSVTINYSNYASAVSETYYFSVSGSTLTMTNVSDSEVSTYIKAN